MERQSCSILLNDGNTQLEVKLEKDTVWLTQSQMAELFGRDRTGNNTPYKKHFQEGELDTLVCAKNAQPNKDGRREDYIILHRRQKAHSRQHPRCHDADDCREPHRRERCNGEGGGESHQQGKSIETPRYEDAKMYRKRLGLGRGKKFDPNVFDWDKTNKRIAAMIDFIRVNTKERCNLILTQYRGITITSVRIFKDEEMICTTFLRP